jgi:hypothetical protein
VSRTIAVSTSIFVAHDSVVVACAHDGDRVVDTTAVSDEGTRWTVSGPAGAKWTRSGQEERIVWNEDREQFADAVLVLFFVVLERTKESGEGEC